MTFARRLVLCSALLIALSPPARACGWDSDTVFLDARYMRDVLAVLVGKFPRNPPLYYEMRLARSAKTIASHPESLAAYDDAGVACDKLGRSDEAIAWMDRKRAQLDRLGASNPEHKEHLYRYLANQGTFYVHRWVRQGAPRDRMGDVEQSLKLLGEALRVNPAAHFGRERYQVKAVEWLLTPPPSLERVVIFHEAAPRKSMVLLLVPGYLGPMPSRPSLVSAKAAGVVPIPPDAARGLAGLVALGSAWESADVFHNLAIALRYGEGDRTALSAIASLRARELVAAGHGTLYPHAPADVSSAIGFPEASFNFGELNWDEQQRAFGRITRAEYRKLRGATFLAKQYFALRAEADAWSAARNAYLLAHLERGEHPDTHRDFWRGFDEPKTPLLDRARADPRLDLLAEFDHPAK